MEAALREGALRASPPRAAADALVSTARRREHRGIKRVGTCFGAAIAVCAGGVATAPLPAVVTNTLMLLVGALLAVAFWSLLILVHDAANMDDTWTARALARQWRASSAANLTLGEFATVGLHRKVAAVLDGEDHARVAGGLVAAGFSGTIAELITASRAVLSSPA